MNNNSCGNGFDNAKDALIDIIANHSDDEIRVFAKLALIKLLTGGAS